MPEAMPDRVWLIAGTGEGPGLATIFLARGWRVRVSVVTANAASAYPDHAHLEIRVGALGGAQDLRSQLEEADQRGDPFHWLVDASHPFAARITSAAIEASRTRPHRLVRLHRPHLAGPRDLVVSRLGDLAPRLAGERILLAIGARHLQEAVRACRGAVPHARVLPQPQALRLAQQAGLPPQRIACCRPTADGALEEALCRHWGIETVFCRQSGGQSEALWQDIAARLGLRLLLLERPAEPPELLQLPFGQLVEHVGWPDGGSDDPDPSPGSCAGADDGGEPEAGGDPR